MRTSALQERRNRQILADVVRAYIETGEPVSSRVISARFEEILSTATIRNVMGELEDGGILVSAAHFGGSRADCCRLSIFRAGDRLAGDTERGRSRMDPARDRRARQSFAKITERAGHVLAEVSNGLGIIVSPPMGKTVIEHARMWLLPDTRVVVVLISPGGNTRDKILKPARRSRSRNSMRQRTF